jgi:UDP-glucose 4-epimerase
MSTLLRLNELTNPNTVLVTGASGYIGSHTCLELALAGYEVVALDNYSNSSPLALQRVESIVGRTFKRVSCDLRNMDELRQVFANEKFQSIVHFAAFKSVAESMNMPLAYYENNISGGLNLLKCMQEFGVVRLVFSSSATVYGKPKYLPIDENHRVATTSPYGRTKLHFEEVLRDLHMSQPDRLGFTILRYFNPVGAHPSGLIGESPMDVPSNLFPYIAQVAVGKRPHVNVYGADYSTVDGSGLRDYVHVCDVARGHIAALEKLVPGHINIYNLGTGKGTTVLQAIRAFENAVGREIPFKVQPRREGDIDASIADVTKSRLDLGWVSEFGLEQMCSDHWRWQTKSPNGYC